VRKAVYLGIIALVTALLPACSGSGLAEPDGTTVLRILEGSSDVAPDGGDFEPGGDGMTLRPGDTVRTGEDGRAAIEWFDGSVTRLDRGTSLTITTLGVDGTDTVVEASQERGNTYHVVAELAGAGSRFEVATPTAVAAVQGTEYALFVLPSGDTTVAVLVDSVTVGVFGESIPVAAGLSLDVPTSAASATDLSDPQPIPQELLDGEWLTFNEAPPPPFFEAALGLDLVGINYYPIGAEVTVAIYSEEGGELLDEGAVLIDSPDDNVYQTSVDIVPGQYVEVSVGDWVRETVVVPLTFDVFDRETQTLEGTAEPGAVVVAFVEVAPSGLIERIETVADADGNWSLVVSGFEILPHHTASVRIEDADGDTTLAHAPDLGGQAVDPEDTAGLRA
jgi:hypothetical protein